jgi:hypothetical protein
MLVADIGVVVPEGNSAMLSQGLDRLLIITPVAHHSMVPPAEAHIHAEFSMERAR